MPVENGYYYIDTSVTVEAWEINAAFGRSGYMGIWEARNGRYGAINTNSDMRPNGPGLSTYNGYAYSEWRGYMHTTPAIRVALFQTERRADADTRVTRYHWENSYISQSWQWGTTTLRPWFYFPSQQRIDVYYDNSIGWGSSWTTADRRYYTNYRGYLVNVREPARNFRNYVGPYTISGEQITITNQS